MTHSTRHQITDYKLQVTDKTDKLLAVICNLSTVSDRRELIL